LAVVERVVSKWGTETGAMSTLAPFERSIRYVGILQDAAAGVASGRLLAGGYERVPG
jgi:hypothetical protein